MIEEYINYKIAMFHLGCGALAVVLIIVTVAFVVWKLYKWMMRQNKKDCKK